jgi:hypothetical protein
MNVKISLLQIPRDLQLILQSSWLSAFIAVMPDRSSVNSSSNEIAPEESLIDRVYPSGLSIKVPFSTIFNYCLGTLTGTSSITGVTSQQSVSTLQYRPQSKVCILKAKTGLCYHPHLLGL